MHREGFLAGIVLSPFAVRAEVTPSSSEKRETTLDEVVVLAARCSLLWRHSISG